GTQYRKIVSETQEITNVMDSFAAARRCNGHGEASTVELVQQISNASNCTYAPHFFFKQQIFLAAIRPNLILVEVSKKMAQDVFFLSPVANKFKLRLGR